MTVGLYENTYSHVGPCGALKESTLVTSLHVQALILTQSHDLLCYQVTVTASLYHAKLTWILLTSPI